MAKYTVTVVDTTGIQSYVFGSNRLQENIGASELVRLATGEWALREVIRVAEKQNNVEDSKTGKLDEGFEIDSTEGDAAEVVYAGGGNVIVLFSSLPLAQAFTRNLTRRVLRQAPGLSLVVAHAEVDWNSNPQLLSTVVTELLNKRLAARKASRLPSTPLLGVGVTASCESTGLVAAETNEEWKPPGEPVRLVSREVAAKLEFSDKANQHLKEMFKEKLAGYEFPFQIDNLGRISGEESYVAVIHADGNGMGDRIKRIAGDPEAPPSNREYVKALRAFSDDVKQSAMKAFLRVVELLIKRITWQRHRDEIKEFVAARIPMEGSFLPFRPLVFGGDDVTFVCNGLLGVVLAVEYLRAFEEEVDKEDPEKPKSEYVKALRACAGVAIVKMHYPFARAYALSEQLATSAKAFVWEEYGEKTPQKAIRLDASAFDWHIATSGLSGNLEEIRRREYHVANGALCLRPLLLGSAERHPDGRAWHHQVEVAVRAFRSSPPWSEMRNKVKALREELRKGPDAVRAFRRNFGIEKHELPGLVPGDKEHRQTGWRGNTCLHFDAIELTDYYLPLDEPPAEQGDKQ
jgi:hypothetical protein